jgi:hypothetical protein
MAGLELVVEYGDRKRRKDPNDLGFLRIGAKMGSLTIECASARPILPDGQSREAWGTGTQFVTLNNG